VTLTVPRSYTALAGDLLVVFTASDDDTPVNNTDWYIDVVESRDSGHLSPLTTVDIPGGYSDGEVIIGCGVIDVAGQLVVRLVDSTTSDVVAQSSIVDVAWPSVTLRLPESHKALTDDVRVTLSVDDRVCQSQQSHVSYTIQLVYLGVNTSSHSHRSVVYTQTLAILTSPSSQIVVSCALVDRAGSYQAVLTSSRRSDVPVAVSNVVVVGWSRRYSLSLSPASTPCRKQVVVHHTQPRCADVVYTVRLFVRQLPSYNDKAERVGDVTRSRDWRYVSERRVKSSRTSVTFDCALVERDDVMYRQLCALLLSTAGDDSVNVHRRFCAAPVTRRRAGQSQLHPLTLKYLLYFNTIIHEITIAQKLNSDGLFLARFVSVVFYYMHSVRLA